MSKQNPLHSYFRAVKFYITLPSNPDMYPEGTIEYTEEGEVGIMGMTAHDELIIKSPDSLLNGSAITHLISSCVPAIKTPETLIANDIDALLLAIKHASYGDDIETKADCPECSAENTFVLNISQSLTNITPLEKEYFIETSAGMRIYGKPLAFPLLIKTLQQQFEQEKIMAIINKDNTTDDQKMKLFSTSINKIAKMSSDLISGSVLKITIPDVEEEITNEKHITDFLNNVEKELIGQIHDLLNEINNTGITKTLEATCNECEHKWTVNIDFNPMTFFSES